MRWGSAAIPGRLLRRMCIISYRTQLDFLCPTRFRCNSLTTSLTERRSMSANQFEDRRSATHRQAALLSQRAPLSRTARSRRAASESLLKTDSQALRTTAQPQVFETRLRVRYAETDQ